ncbi:MAG TPA: flagellar basal body-associated FliL family protein [Clostridia bacterium]|nr:flagellar basal body-associated FliL family protein [Clostridia bacterium]
MPAKKSRGLGWAFVALLITAAVLAAMLLVVSRRQAHKRTVVAEPPVGAVLHLETFVVNVGESEQGGYLRVGIDLGLESAPGKSGEGKESQLPTAMIRDTTLGVLSVAKADELLTAEGKKKLKETLQQALNARAPELRVREVYFTEFMMQR